MYCLLRPVFIKSLKLLSKIKLKHICFGVGLIFVFDFFGVFTHMFETSYDESFVYPYEGDIHEYITALRHNEKPSIAPINEYNYSFTYDLRDKCMEPGVHTFRIVILIKSAVENFHRRMAIRHSWGFEKRFSDVPIKIIFLLGKHYDDDELKTKVNTEAMKFQDIVQADFMDSYYNNTIKTMMGFKWAFKYCSNSKFYMFVDDDMYVSVKNVLRFLKNPTLYPDYLKDAIKFKDLEHLKNRYKRTTVQEKDTKKNIAERQGVNKSIMSAKIVEDNNIDLQNLNKNLVNNNNNTNLKKLVIRKKRQVFDFELPESVRLFAGYVFVSAPHRHKSSKWYVTLKEYPYHLWPPYVTAGSFILSKEALIDMYYTSMYTKHFRFDDIFLGLVAKKADIEPFHCEEFHFYKKDYTKYNYKYVISSHGYDDPDELLRVWNEQKAMGNA